MAQDDHSGSELAAADSSHAANVPAVKAGTALVQTDTFENPGFEPHRPRVTDEDPAREKRAQRTVYTLFYLSILGSVWAIAAYMLFPIESNDVGAVRLNNMFIGLGSALALLGIGFGAVHWGKTLMTSAESIDIRHPIGSTETTKQGAVEVFRQADEESGFSRRSVIRNSLIGALLVMPLPAVVLFRGLAPQDQHPVELLSHTMWKKGTRLTLDPSGVPIKAADVTIGSAFHVIPEGLSELHEGRLEEKAKAAVLLMRLNPEELNETEERSTWSYDGIVAYSKICTHVGCPVALYEQHTHHLLCPCHQSQFDVANHCEVIFGPAARPLPQLPIEVDDEGYLVAQSDFTEPVGPSFWERH
ncbi:ubiquinol-cytochrome c reductase iron-sulfur subunit [Agromyces flavus]|uniref:Cytochrome bc1 complex Rieske iron-sulfur subunit n=1 Tax=Agromyces flavus TaxID=589382 RepID=A0A1H1RMU5_9MICO|nr:ubiquinol-cytochrome c reductase iron-sulfur subunit [Agromyces flavus]MCP2368845.1 ubiquinol-cytochrome c reductase iron-sulfur subunit [Agromyces flavus]GGI48301.1 ubiquinol-cytochrome c reductase [Agromyces flavus]SDS36953.1 menaquinol-cytochrome c reductase iron-sulfur subunit precursor [Agromyces flavus]